MKAEPATSRREESEKKDICSRYRRCCPLSADVSMSRECFLSCLEKKERTRFDLNIEDGFSIADFGGFIEVALCLSIQTKGSEIFIYSD